MTGAIRLGWPRCPTLVRKMIKNTDNLKRNICMYGSVYVAANSLNLVRVLRVGEQEECKLKLQYTQTNCHAKGGRRSPPFSFPFPLLRSIECTWCDSFAFITIFAPSLYVSRRTFVRPLFFQLGTLGDDGNPGARTWCW